MEEFKEKIREILDLIATCRYLAARKVYNDLFSALNDSSVSTEVREAVNLQLEKDETVQTMLQRADLVENSIRFVDTSDDWILGADMFGIQTHYRKCEDDENAIVVKIEGKLDDLPLFEQMAVLHEIDLYKEWAPFCTSSVMIDKIGQAELFGYLCVGLPMFSRDFLMHAYAGDCMQEYGKVVILGHSVEKHPDESKEKSVPWKSCGWLHKRMHVQDMEAVVEALSPNTAQMKIICRVDLNAPLPHTLINFLIRKLAGVILYMIQRQTVKVQHDDQCNHAHRIRSNHAFYRDWLLPKFRYHCDMQGWQQPTINALGADGIPPETPVPLPASASTAAPFASGISPAAGESVLGEAQISETIAANDCEVEREEEEQETTLSNIDACVELD